MNIRMGLFKTWTLEHKQIVFMYNNCSNTLLYTGYYKSNRCFVFSHKLMPPVVRYGEKHIGLGTKRFVDALGSC